MNKKLKKMLAAVSAMAMCAIPMTFLSAGALGVCSDRKVNQYTTSFYSNNIKYTFWQTGTDFYGIDGFRVYVSEPIKDIDSITGEEVIKHECLYVRTYMINDEKGGQFPFNSLGIGGVRSADEIKFTARKGSINEDKMPLIEEYLLKNSILYTKVEYEEIDMTAILIDNENMTIDEMANRATEIRKAVDWSFDDMVLPTSVGMIEVTNVENVLPEPTLTGDSNEDGEVSIADAILIMQSLVNPDEYSLTPQGIANADMNGDGITTLDALLIQEMLVKK